MCNMRRTGWCILSSRERSDRTLASADAALALVGARENALEGIPDATRAALVLALASLAVSSAIASSAFCHAIASSRK